MKKIFNALSVLCFIYCLSYLLFRYQEISRIASSASLKILFLPAYSFLVGSGAMLFSPLLAGRRQLTFRHLAYAVVFFYGDISHGLCSRVLYLPLHKPF